MNLILPAYLAADNPQRARKIIRVWLHDRYPNAIVAADSIPDDLEQLRRISDDWHIDPATVNYWARRGTVDAEKYQITIGRSVGACRRWVWFANRRAVEAVLEKKGYKRKNA